MHMSDVSNLFYFCMYAEILSNLASNMHANGRETKHLLRVMVGGTITLNDV